LRSRTGAIRSVARRFGRGFDSRRLHRRFQAILRFKSRRKMPVSRRVLMVEGGSHES